MQYNPIKIEMALVTICCKGCLVVLLTTTAYSGRLDDEDEVASGFGFADVSSFEEVLVFGLVLIAVLACLRSTW